MTKQEFTRFMDNAIADCTWKVYGGYTCNILSLQDGKKDHNKLTKARKKYTRIFGFAGARTVDSKVSNFELYKYGFIKNVRINCLELFKIVMLESKGYEEL